MNDKIFYPKNAGMSKQDIVDMIEERKESDYPQSYRTIGKIDINKMSDRMAQNFVDSWFEVTVEGFCDSGLESYAERQEQLLLIFAQAIES